MARSEAYVAVGMVPADIADLDPQRRLKKQATIASVCVATLLISVKLAAWLMTDSVAVLSALFDSFLDAAASIVTLIAVRCSMEPADHEHRFGHGKAEALAGLAQAAFICGSSVLLLIEAIRRLFDPRSVQAENIGIAVMIFSIVVTLALVAFQRHVVRRTRSIAIEGDSLHYASDIALNGSVIIVLGAHAVWGWTWLDPVLAIGIVAWLLWNARKVGMVSLDMLLDRELPEEERDRIKKIVLGHPEARSLHDLRSRRSGTDTFIQFHLVLSPDVSLMRAHDIADEVELAIMEAYPNAEVIIHQDPEGLEEAHPKLAAS
ncbi:MAG: cation diffusion facilitator family transporter [Rhodospirillaceae bacterium]|nr:cation diffusion facilitator family transporter [Rhodospirillaceae bacterium]